MNLHRALLPFILASSVLAQPLLTLSLGPSVNGPVVTVGFTDSTPTSSTAGIQLTLSLPAGVTVGTAPAPGSASANKLITCATNNLSCIDVGDGTTLNATPFASGPLMTFTLTGTPTTSPGTIALINVLGANSSSGSTVNITATATLVLSKYDLNSDGLVNGADVQVAIQAYETVQGGGTCPVNVVAIGDGKCDITAVVSEILAALGVIH